MIHARRRVVQAALLAFLCWLPMIVAALLWAPNWPQAIPIYRAVHHQPVIVGAISASEAWAIRGLTVLLSSFLFFKAFLILRRSGLPDRLATALVVVNLTLGATFEVSTALATWPALNAQVWLRAIVYAVAIVAVMWAAVEFARTRDEPPSCDVYVTIAELRARISALELDVYRWESETRRLQHVLDLRAKDTDG